MEPKTNLFRTRLEALRPAGVRPGLENMRSLLAALGNPQDGLRFVHVAGTNGKGAVCAMVESVLRAAGYRTGRYTSPHLISLNERICLCGEPVGDEKLEEIAGELFAAVEKTVSGGANITFFECMTAAAFLVFRNAATDVVVLETGLGGRYDATNAIGESLVAAITRIGLDHCDWLGSTYAEIAAEKAGILRPGRPVVCGAMPESAKETIERFASLEGCGFTAADDYVSVLRMRPFTFTTPLRNPPPVRLSLEGAFQAENAATAIAVIDILCRRCGFHVSDSALCKGLAETVWPGRFHRMERDGVRFIVDGAHNPDGAMALRDSIRQAGIPGPVAFLCGFCGDKDVLANLRVLSAISTKGWSVPLSNSRSLAPESVAERMGMAGFTETGVCGSLAEGLAKASEWAKSSGGTIVVCGSLFLAGETLAALGAFPWPAHSPDANEIFHGVPAAGTGAEADSADPEGARK